MTMSFEKALQRLNDEHSKKVANLLAARGRIEEAQALCDALNQHMRNARPNLTPCVTVHESSPASVRVLGWSWYHSIEEIRQAIKQAGLVIERELEAVDYNKKQETIIWIKGIDCRLIWTLEDDTAKEAA